MTIITRSDCLLHLFVFKPDSRVAPIWGSLHAAGAEHQKKNIETKNIVLNIFFFDD